MPLRTYCTIAPALLVLALACCPSVPASAAPPASDNAAKSAAAAPTAEEARARARLLHETIHATLQIVHHEYYREDEALKIPAATMRRVFHEVGQRQNVELRWLAVNAQAMNADHQPRDAFEKLAVEALGKGNSEFEQASEDKYRLAGSITLTSDCLKCHAPNRTDTKPRAAALVITIPLARP